MDEVDMKLLYYLDVDARYPVKRIAKLIKEKGEKINYRLKRLFREKIIRRCFAEINPWKIGFTSFKVYFQFQGVDKDKIDEMYLFLVKNCNVGWIASCMGRYDMIVEIMAKDRHEFLEMYSKFHKKYYEHILTKEVGVTTELFFMNKKWLAPHVGKPSIAKMVGKPENLVDEKDIKILCHLVKNGRDPVKRIAQSLKLPATTVSQRIANLVKRGVIAGFRTDVDLKKFDRVYCKSFIYFSQGDKEDVRKMIEYCMNHPDIIFITKCIAPWDMEIEANTHSFNDFTLLMNDLKNRFPNVVRNFEAAVINKDTSDLCKPRD